MLIPARARRWRSEVGLVRRDGTPGPARAWWLRAIANCLKKKNSWPPAGRRRAVMVLPSSALLPTPRSLACTNAALVGVARFSHVWALPVLAGLEKIIVRAVMCVLFVCMHVQLHMCSRSSRSSYSLW